MLKEPIRVLHELVVRIVPLSRGYTRYTLIALLMGLSMWQYQDGVSKQPEVEVKPLRQIEPYDFEWEFDFERQQNLLA